MRLVSTSDCQEGMQLAKAIFNDDGLVLINEGVQLTKKMIERLVNMGITYVYIKDSRTEDIVIPEVLTEETRRLAMETIKEQFSKLSDSGKLLHAVQDPKFIKSFKKSVECIIEDLNNFQGVMSALTNMYSYDQYTFTHSLHVTIYSITLAMAKNYSEKQILEIGLGAMLHDIGKLTTPHEILTKPGKLTEEEFAIIKEHPTTGFEILRKIHEVPFVCAHCAYQHHERENGSGYPRGLKDKEIHEYAKLIGLCDVFDALTSHRSYRKAMPAHQAMEIIFAGSGTLFQKELVELFRDTISLYPVGMTVKLSDGSIGVVIALNKSLPSRPVVRLIRDQMGQATMKEINLAEKLSLVIAGPVSVA